MHDEVREEGMEEGF